MIDSGVFELGGHTITHPYLPNTSIEDKKYEMIECKNILETTFNTKVSSFVHILLEYIILRMLKL